MTLRAPRSFTAIATAALVALPLFAPAATSALAAEEAPATEPDASGDDASGDAEDEAAAEEPISFVDTEGRSHEEAVAMLADEGVVRGCGEDRFCPDAELTRGQMATVLVNALDLEPLEVGPFTDIVGSSHEFAINRIAAEGITVGCEEGRFCPNDTMTREQAASLLARTFEPDDTDESFFDDLSSTHGASVERLAAQGIVAGCGDSLTDFCSGDPVLRWHAAFFLARAMELVEPVALAPLEERRAEQARIDAEREAALEAERAAEREAERQAEADRRAASRLAMWESLARCESNGRWNANTGNGYYGGLQFHLQTWRGVGGSGYPHQASKSEQIRRAEILLTRSWASFGNQWPACSRRLGLS